MPNLKDIRARIQSTKNTQKITSAMKMVSAAKLRRAQQSIVALRPYAMSILTLIADISATQKVEHPLLGLKENPKRLLLVVVTSDRGLCGAFNTNVSKFAESYYKQQKVNFETVDFFFVGKKALEYFKRRDLSAVDQIQNLANQISYDFADSVSEKIIQYYLSGAYEEIRFIYNEFKSAISQVTIGERLLPVDVSAQSSFDRQVENSSGARFPADLIFEPKPEMIIDDLLKRHFAIQVYRCLAESVAAEHGARMTSMENATKNAGELVRGLTLTYNKIRQASITREIIEITSGAEAL
jgi:F-type H+-transporting ATPase subunit gamma